MHAEFIAEWLNSFFAGYDRTILSALHKLAEAAGTFFTPLMRFVTFIGEKGIAMFLLAFVLVLFRKTRKAGICVFGAVCCGALITNIILKDAVARIRPYEAVCEFNLWWQTAGAVAENGFSFPSGHVTALTAGMSALTFVRGKNYILPTVISVFLMGFSRNYLVAHYPSDVLGAMIIGLLSAAVAYAVTRLIYFILDKYKDKAFFRFILNADISSLFLRKEKQV